MVVIVFLSLLLVYRNVRHLDRSKHRAFQEVTTTLESITDAFLQIDKDWRFSYINAEVERVLSLKREALIGLTMWEVFPEAIGTVFERNYRKAVEEGIRAQFEAYFAPHRQWYAVRAYPSTECFRKALSKRSREQDATILHFPLSCWMWTNSVAPH